MIRKTKGCCVVMRGNVGVMRGYMCRCDERECRGDERVYV